MRFALSLLAAATVAAAAPAHFVFVSVVSKDAQREARLVFGHDADPEPGASAERCANTKLTAADAAGRTAKLAVTKGDPANFYRAELPAGEWVAVWGVTDAGVTQRGDQPPMLSTYYPKALLGDPFAAKPVGTELEVVPVKAEGGVRFKVLSKSKPLADSEVTVLPPGKDADHPEGVTVQTDAAGLTPAYAATGRYCVAARRLDATPGARGGKPYAKARHTATLVADIPAK